MHELSSATFRAWQAERGGKGGSGRSRIASPAFKGLHAGWCGCDDLPSSETHASSSPFIAMGPHLHAKRPSGVCGLAPATRLISRQSVDFGHDPRASGRRFGVRTRELHAAAPPPRQQE